VTLTRTYLLGQFEVSRREWGLWMPEAGMDPRVVDEESPVTNISWHDMAYFANQLSVADGLEPCARCSVVNGENRCEVRPDPYACEGYRLSTKAEWTFACFERGRHADDCPAGGVPRISEVGGPEPLVGPDAPPNAVFSDFCHNRNETRTFLPVTSAKLPNALGFFGMCGNGQDATLDSAGLSEFNPMVSLTDPYLHDPFDGAYNLLGGSLQSSTSVSGCTGVSAMTLDNNRDNQTVRLARTLTAPRHP
jgi:formylglycine-generating enzyme required for sulfatase activity